MDLLLLHGLKLDHGEIHLSRSGHLLFPYRHSRSLISLLHQSAIQTQLMKAIRPLPLLLLYEVQSQLPLLHALLPKEAGNVIIETGQRHGGKVLLLSEDDLLGIVVVAGLEVRDQAVALLPGKDLIH